MELMLLFLIAGGVSGGASLGGFLVFSAFIGGIDFLQTTPHDRRKTKKYQEYEDRLYNTFVESDGECGFCKSHGIDIRCPRCHRVYRHNAYQHRASDFHSIEHNETVMCEGGSWNPCFESFILPPLSELK